MSKPAGVATLPGTMAAVGAAELAKAQEAINERFATEYGMVMGALQHMPADLTLEGVRFDVSVTIKRMKKDTAGKMSVEVSATHKIQTEKAAGVAKYIDGQLIFTFDEQAIAEAMQNKEAEG